MTGAFYWPAINLIQFRYAWFILLLRCNILFCFWTRYIPMDFRPVFSSMAATGWGVYMSYKMHLHKPEPTPSQEKSLAAAWVFIFYFYFIYVVTHRIIEIDNHVALFKFYSSSPDHSSSRHAGISKGPSPLGTIVLVFPRMSSILLFTSFMLQVANLPPLKRIAWAASAVCWG